jgi:uncharacterized protein YdeI (YjbR/CyaY-like superfamily)
MKPHFFKSNADFRKWLEKNHKSETELVVGFYKVSSSKFNMTWSQSVDEAICYGWIDGIRRSIDEERYCIRFTPRNPRSIWSKINIKKVEDLTRKGLMTQAGLNAFSFRDDSRSGIYSFENLPHKLPVEFEKVFRNNKPAWNYFKKQAPSYQKMICRWITSARLESTRLSRLQKTISASLNETRLFQ